jgi:hypothetical protein
MEHLGFRFMSEPPTQAPLLKAIRDALAERDMSQRQLGAEVGALETGTAIPQSSVAEWLAGKVWLRPHRVFCIERVLGLRAGQLSRLDGYVPVGASPTMTPEEAIEADPDISAVYKRLLVSTMATARVETRRDRDRKRARR